MGWVDIYIPARYHKIRSKTDIVAITFRDYISYKGYKNDVSFCLPVWHDRIRR